MHPSRPILLALSIALAGVSSIQAQQPQPTGAMAFARVGNNFYVHGGATFGDNLVQLFWALDLTTSWTTTQPAWTILQPGPYNAYHAAGYSADNNTFITFGRDTGAAASVMPSNWINIYDIKAGTWSTADPPAGVDTSRRDFSPVTNPANNKIYILGGDATATGAVQTNVFDIYDVGTKTLTEITTPPTGPQNAYTYAGVWVPRLSSMAVIGGQMGPEFPSSLWLYDAGTGAWSTKNTTGAFAYNRVSPCAASNADGSLIAVFGGFVGPSTAADPTLYILDTVTWTWTTHAYSGKGRGNSACAIVDNTFLTWGGWYTIASTNPNLVNSPQGAEAMLLFSLSSKTWETTYTPSPAMSGKGGSGSGGSGSGGSGSGDSDNNSGNKTIPGGSVVKPAISTGAIGGIAAAAVILILVAGFVLRRRITKKRIDHTKPPTPEAEFVKEEEAGGDASAYHSFDGRPSRPPPPPENLSPALYDFEEPPTPMMIDAQRIHSQQMQMRNSLQPGYTQQAYMQPSPQMSDIQHAGISMDGYSSPSGFSSYSSPTNTPLIPIANSSSSGVSPYQQQQYVPDEYSGTNSMYYPPPPSMQNQSSGYTPLHGQRESLHLYKVPAEVVGRDGNDYHDMYGMTRMSMMSNSTTASTKGLRPVSAPQGGYFGSQYEPSFPGAPQSIPEEH
ncbi:hypothetical protein BGZ54_004080 [Gamsiella multidivaricata]|nr:hypothetical protein BGZ54_004080 [Gamsiella multidivaricata]